jgi:hypothetical protein
MSFVIARRSAAVVAIGAAGFILPVSHSLAQWWKRAPVDFEECADAAEKSASKAEKTAALANCNAKFAGRRKPGGGYTYYDFLQDRTFNIAGPNPTPDEQKKIDEFYTAYLASQRRNTAMADAAASQQLELTEPVQQVAPQSEAPRVPVPRPRPKGACAKGSFSCEWPRLSEGLNELKKLFNPTPGKPAKKG